MSSDTSSSTSDDTLQFDRAVPAGSDQVEETSVPTCSACSQELSTFYFTVERQPLCSACTRAVEEQITPVKDWSTVLRAAGFGLGAAIVGAAIYYGVIAITEFEIGLVAILIGYMVGHSVRKGARGRGGLRLQLTAVFLTYFAVSIAYLPLAIQGATESATSETSVLVDADSAVLAAAPRPDDTSTAVASDTTPDSTVAAATFVGVVPGIAMLLAFALALPVLVVFGSLPSGLISALIIGIGMRQAWTMTGSSNVTIHGPYRVGREPGDPPTGTVPT